MLRVKSEEWDNSVVLRCAGRMVRGEETALLCAAVRHRGRNIILDMNAVDAIDAAGVGALVSLQAAGIYLQLMNPPKAVREVLRVTRLDSVFEIVSSSQKDIREEGAGQEAAIEPLLSPMVATATH